MIRRRLFNFASAVSLLLCLGTIVMWVRSYRAMDTVRRGVGPKWELACCSIEGHINFCIGRLTNMPAAATIVVESDHLAVQIAKNGIPWSVLESYSGDGSGWGRTERAGVLFPFGRPAVNYKVESWFVAPRYWQLVLVFASAPAWMLIRYLRSRGETDPSVCAECSYNLTANISGVCPECGTPIPSKSEVVA